MFGHMLQFGKRRSARLSCTEGCLRGEDGSEDVLFEEVLTDKFFQIHLEALAVDSLVLFTIVIRTIFFCFRSVESY